MCPREREHPSLLLQFSSIWRFRKTRIKRTLFLYVVCSFIYSLASLFLRYTLLIRCHAHLVKIFGGNVAAVVKPADCPPIKVEMVEHGFVAQWSKWLVLLNEWQIFGIFFVVLSFTSAKISNNLEQCKLLP